MLVRTSVRDTLQPENALSFNPSRSGAFWLAVTGAVAGTLERRITKFNPVTRHRSAARVVARIERPRREH